MSKLRDFFSYLPSFMIFMGLLNFSDMAGEGTMRALLRVYAVAAGVFYGRQHVYVAGEGYVAAGGDYAIGPECAGMGFTALLFVVCAVLFMKHFTGGLRVWWTVACLIGAVLVGFAANTIRILGSIPFIGFERFGFLHAASGAVLYVCLLAAIHIGLRRYFERSTACEGRKV